MAENKKAFLEGQVEYLENTVKEQERRILYLDNLNQQAFETILHLSKTIRMYEKELER